MTPGLLFIAGVPVFALLIGVALRMAWRDNAVLAWLSLASSWAVVLAVWAIGHEKVGSHGTPFYFFDMGMLFVVLPCALAVTLLCAGGIGLILRHRRAKALQDDTTYEIGK